ncbi:phosphate signaling complex PhoU family protein [Nocardia sp. alder85J]|uniref:phosphate signaling complex PhoU family protein n=1 Tax=Nocardia sp. alder85J TaxID=2862949 RepID=UPI001CD43FED|nr:PhoU domain-containing protein [Nocardia sp. alder85J]MCX4096563.1 phosphate uptake regulator, PhoU [Nocardia sp. alder85J]
MRTKFSSELAALTEELAGLASLAQEATERVAVAVTEANLTAAYEVFAIDEQLRQRHGACENRAVILLALEAPVARDLRHVVSAMQIGDDLAQMSWLTSRIADSVVHRYPAPVAAADIIELLGEIGRATADLAAAARRAIIADTPAADDSPVLPDRALAEARQQLLQAVSAPDWPHGHATAVDLALLVHHYERCAEHCVRIGRLIRFFHTGLPLSVQTPEE